MKIPWFASRLGGFAAGGKNIRLVESGLSEFAAGRKKFRIGEPGLGESTAGRKKFRIGEPGLGESTAGRKKFRIGEPGLGESTAGRKKFRIVWSKLALFALCLLPFAWLLADTLLGRLGADPVQQITHRSGDWTLRLLLATLAVTPLRRVTGYNRLIGYRRMLGLFAFCYACLHFATYLLLDLGGFWSQIGTDIVERPFITVGFLAWLSMLPLALTSTRGMVRRLGRRWQRLHRLIYATGILAVLHYLWLVKADRSEPLLYAGILAVLLGARLRVRGRKSASSPDET